MRRQHDTSGLILLVVMVKTLLKVEAADTITGGDKVDTIIGGEC